MLECQNFLQYCSLDLIQFVSSLFWWFSTKLFSHLYLNFLDTAKSFFPCIKLSQYFLGQFFCEIKREYKSQFKIQIGLFTRRFSCSKYLEVLPIERRWRSFSFGESVLFTSCFDHKAKRDSSWQSCICNLRRDPPSLLKARLVVDTMMSG